MKHDFHGFDSNRKIYVHDICCVCAYIQHASRTAKSSLSRSVKFCPATIWRYTLYLVHIRVAEPGLENEYSINPLAAKVVLYFWYKSHILKYTMLQAWWYGVRILPWTTFSFLFFFFVMVVFSRSLIIHEGIYIYTAVRGLTRGKSD